MKYLRNINSTLKTESPFLYSIVVLHILCIIPCVYGIIADDRLLMGVNVWVKPLKFVISGVIYVASIGFLTTLYPYSKRKKKIVLNTVALTMILELIIILYQGFRGVKSHYNFDSSFDALMFAAMGMMVGMNVLIMVMFIFDTIRKKLNTSKVVQWSILLGWLIILYGSAVGGQMIGQLSHNVGVVDGGEGLPFLNWSTIAGDLRVAHFFGLHGLQIIPLFAFFVSKKWKTTHTNHVIAVSIFAALYIAWISFTFYQAKQGIPFLKM